MTKAQEKKLKRGDRIRMKSNLPLNAGEEGIVLARMNVGVWIRLDSGASFTIPYMNLVLLKKEAPAHE